MRPQKAKQILSNAIQFYLRNDLSTTRLYQKETLVAVHKLDQQLRKEFSDGGWDYDNRCPKDLFNYADPENEFIYLSDRFMAPHRLNFLLVGIKEQLF
jgi:hypothetical protein